MVDIEEVSECSRAARNRPREQRMVVSQLSHEPQNARTAGG